MRRLRDTIARLAAGGMPAALRSDATTLHALGAFGSNPGALAGWFHIPEDRADDAAMPLVVVLHGCTQTAAGYDRGSGWSDLADRFGFAVLFPEQARANNPNACFNWFVPEDIRRDGGEAASIRQMIAAMADRFAIDSARIFVTGLSAGGAMASTMLATYPEVFAGGAIIAGLPHGTATSVSQALDRMRGHGLADDATLAAAVRAASPHDGAWPRIGVWHGSADRTVDAVNADRIVGQWRALQGLAATPDVQDMVAGQRRQVWRGADGSVAIEAYRIAGMGHGTPIATIGETACGTPMAHMLDAGISSTWQIAQGWGLLTEERQVERPQAAPSAPAPVAGVQATIEAALRSAGLMR